MGRAVERADREAAGLSKVLGRVEAGSTRSAAVGEFFPDRPRGSMLARLRRFEADGRDGLIDRRAPWRNHRKVTDEVRGAVRLLAKLWPEAGSAELAEELSAQLDVDLGASTVREVLVELGLSRPRGRPRGGGRAGAPTPPEEEQVRPLGMAGAEMLKAVDQHVGAVASLTRVFGEHMETLPAPTGEVLDDREHRDERGRFLPSYNQSTSRTVPELGGRFDTVERRRGEKDLREMRVAKSTASARYRKDLAVTMLPVVVDGARISEVRHWQGRYLGDLVGVAYQPATLDKHLRELKLAGASGAAQRAVMRTWTSSEGAVRDPLTGAVLVYGDVATKPLWTHHFSRSTKVSQTGRVMPATSTLLLHSGAGTPLVYRSFSGSVSMPREVTTLLRDYERAAGLGTAQRIVVMDRESHATWLFKELDAEGWQFIVPLRSNVTGPNARFEDVSEWAPSRYNDDEVCDGMLWLNDSRAAHDAIRQRVVGRRRHRTGNVAWFATNTDPDPFDADEVLRLYFQRWPLQEQRFRDANGRVGLDRHHGYGKLQTDNLAVISRHDKLEGQIRKLDKKRGRLEAERDDQLDRLSVFERADTIGRPLVAQDQEELAAALAAGHSGPEVQEAHRQCRIWERWLHRTEREIATMRTRIQRLEAEIERLEGHRARKQKEVDKLARQQKIFTVDMELDQIMTAYKLTFMNLCRVLMDEYLGVRMELDTLIPAVLRLPGECARTRTTETIRIYEQRRDPATMAAVRKACEGLSALGLERGNPAVEPLRRLTFEVAPHPDDPPEPEPG